MSFHVWLARAGPILAVVYLSFIVCILAPADSEPTGAPQIYLQAVLSNY
jgi:hypothetical protein